MNDSLDSKRNWRRSKIYRKRGNEKTRTRTFGFRKKNPTGRTTESRITKDNDAQHKKRWDIFFFCKNKDYFIQHTLVTTHPQPQTVLQLQLEWQQQLQRLNQQPYRPQQVSQSNAMSFGYPTTVTEKEAISWLKNGFWKCWISD